LYCSTCGGLARKIRNNINADIIRRTDAYLKSLSLREYNKLAEIGDMLNIISPEGVKNVVLREAEIIDVDDTRTLDRFLIRYRVLLRNEQPYKKLVEKAVVKAVGENDDSLVETLVVILKEEIVKHPALLNNAISKMGKISIHRALYNAIRHTHPEVRGYVGDGTTSYYW